MWSFTSEKLDEDGGLKIKVALNSTTATFADVLRAWREDERFRTAFNDLLAQSPYAAFRGDAARYVGNFEPIFRVCVT